MNIEDLPGLEDEHISRLQAIGIHSCQQLRRFGRRRERLVRLSEITGLSPETLNDLVQIVELSQIYGIGPTTLEQLWQLGIDSVAILARQEPEELLADLRTVAERPPNLAMIEDWILQAQRRKGKRGFALHSGLVI